MSIGSAMGVDRGCQSMVSSDAAAVAESVIELGVIRDRAPGGGSGVRVGAYDGRGAQRSGSGGRVTEGTGH